MKSKITTQIISGFLGAGKTSFLNQLLATKSNNETWVVLVNEAGKSQFAKQQLASQGIVVKELYGGCLCCSAGMPFRVALNQLIKEHRPQRLFIEPAGAGHLANIKTLLQGEYYQPILILKDTLCILALWQLLDVKFTTNVHYQGLMQQADKLCFAGEEVENLAKKMAVEYSKPLHQLTFTVKDLS